MNEEMMKMLMKKKKDGKELSDSDKKAKLSAIKEMKDMASEMMSEKLKGLKKVTVASPSEEGLKEGLEKAEELIEQGEGSKPGMMADMPDGEMPEEMKSDEDMHRDMMMKDDEEYLKQPESPEEIDELIAQLQAKKEEMLKRS